MEKRGGRACFCVVWLKKRSANRAAMDSGRLGSGSRVERGPADVRGTAFTVSKDCSITMMIGTRVAPSVGHKHRQHLRCLCEPQMGGLPVAVGFTI